VTHGFGWAAREGAIRLLLKFTIPVAKGNAAAADGTLGAAIEALIEQVKPAAADFTLEQGKRGAS
jgi:uncharacterized protein involved in propanediol utilization